MLASVVPGTVWCRYGQCPSCVLADTIPCSNRTMLDAEWLLLRLISFCRAHQRQSTHTHTHSLTLARTCAFVYPHLCSPLLGASPASAYATWVPNGQANLSHGDTPHQTRSLLFQSPIQPTSPVKARPSASLLARPGMPGWRVGSPVAIPTSPRGLMLPGRR